MTFQKYSFKVQLILVCIFTPLNFFTTVFCSSVLKIPLFMDMIFVYAASFLGIPCGIIVGVVHSLLNSIFYNDNILYSIYSICCITGTLLTRLFVTRYEDFSIFRLVLLFFVSAVVISFEGSVIYAVCFSETLGAKDNPTVLFITYNLVLQNLGVQLSAFLARIPVNLFDKAIAVFGGFIVFLGVDKVYNKIEVNKNGRKSN